MFRSIKNAFIRFFGLTAEEREIRQAIRELNAYTDRELNELGIGRGEIAYLVRNGRPGAAKDPAPSTPKTEEVELPKAA